MLEMLCAVLLDLLLGDPPHFPHPIRVMGRLIAFEEGLLRRFALTRSSVRIGGGMLAVANILLTLVLSASLLSLLRPCPVLFHAVHVYLLYTCLAARCLRDEAMKIERALQQGLAEARQRLSWIVGRDTMQLDEPEIIRATVETVAENSADGVIAPMIFGIIGGAPLALTYKMINTMDSMLGYLNEHYRDIGFLPAKIDDAANYLPARITGLLICLAGLGRFPVLQGLKIMFRDRRNHKSPNCGYPESAVAGLLGVQLGGANVYFGEVVDKPTLGDALRPLERLDIARSCEMMFRAEFLALALYLLAAVPGNTLI
ncbi:cobalamin biosynthesis protein CobD [candidate division KSB3 bacterium]|uniref:Cobalamin biosynthesis protein CobD n=1 Tax=candidate division KSB3 bacterium TaxID=2044937 RepID=A0A2G6EFN9_9BACT|nr:MAG: cobalamin biosynthesis protein CobD [candidate division KSB3 bacterium]PIE31130.1 MAG: cobalamin biosynthesis protein CobD [candidate division KSB3 bacterium]